MRRVLLFGLFAGLGVAAGCAKNPDPVPDYPVSDETLVSDPDELGVDLEPRAQSAQPTTGGEAEEADDEGGAAAEAPPAEVEPPPP